MIVLILLIFDLSKSKPESHGEIMFLRKLEDMVFPNLLF